MLSEIVNLQQFPLFIGKARPVERGHILVHMVHGEHAAHEQEFLPVCHGKDPTIAKIESRTGAIADTLPVILTGDFNAPADPQLDGPYRVLTVTHNWQDTYRSVSPAAVNEGTFNGFSGETTGPRIDWILTTGGLATLDAGIVRTDRDGHFPSDHFPVTATIRLKAANQGE